MSALLYDNKNRCDTCKRLAIVDNDDKKAYCVKGFLPKNMYPFEFGCIFYIKNKDIV